MAKRFAGKVVWITGGGSGIGEALALAFAREGADVAVSGRR
jgi:NAD(P)-dependent dehydrogenase (short-subunit alcohol dehydrogenase family)